MSGSGDVASAINGGVVLTPTLSGPEGFALRERWRLPQGTRYDGLAAGFLAAVNEGSASPAFDPDVAIAGKTGTCAALGWFASYAPAEHPQVVVVVFLRHGSGHSARGWIDRDIVASWVASWRDPGGRADSGRQPVCA